MVTTRHPSAKRRLATLATAFSLCALAAGPAAAAAAGTLQATVEPRVVDAGEPVRLTLRFQGDAAPARPDLSPLEREFDVLGSQQSQRVSIVDGTVEAIHELQIVLSPKHAGEIEIPALQAGALATEPVRLTVRDATGADDTSVAGDASSGAAASASGAAARAATGSAAPPAVVARALRNGQAPPDLFVDASVDQASPFVQGEVRYTVRVYDGLGIREGALTEPAAQGVRIEPRGDTRTYQDEVAGRRYVVHERTYAAFPQSSGDVVIPPVVLQARVPDPDGGARRSPLDEVFDGDDVFAEMFAQMRRSGFGGSILDRMMDPGHEVRVRSNPITLAVQGRPAAAADGWFLPATAVTLTASWDPARPSFRVGETVTRTVTLRATGASATQLPQIVASDVPGVKEYAARPETRDVAGGAELVQRFDVLPTSAGTITLPRIEVPWWDTATGTQQTAVLPAESIAILPAAGSAPQQASAAATASAQQGSAQNASGAAPDLEARQAAPAASASEQGTPHRGRAMAGPLAEHPLATAAGAALLALAAGVAWRRWRRPRDGAPTSDGGRATATAHTGSAPARALVDAVHQACAANDARAARAAVVAWGRAAWRDARPVDALAVARLSNDAAFVRAVKSLDDSLFAPQAASFDGAALRRAFDGARRTAAPVDRETPPVLPALYPDSRLA